jgi:hypothetical protein
LRNKLGNEVLIHQGKPFLRVFILSSLWCHLCHKQLDSIPRTADRKKAAGSGGSKPRAAGALRQEYLQASSLKLLQYSTLMLIYETT